MENCTNTGGEVGRGNVTKNSSGGGAHCVKGGGRGGALSPERENTRGQGSNGTQRGMAGTAMPDAFVSDAILLVGKRQSDEGASEGGGFYM